MRQIILTYDDVRPLVHEATNVTNSSISESFGIHAEDRGGHTEIFKEFYKLIEDTKAELYLGYKTFTQLEFIMTLLHIKLSNK